MEDNTPMTTSLAVENLTTTLAYSNSTVGQINQDEQCRSFTFILYVPVFGTICLFGLVGNALSFMVLRFEKQNHAATFLLQCLAIADNLFLLATGIAQLFSALNLYYEELGVIIPYLMVGVWPLVHITQMLTVWVTLLIALNRYIAICKPFQAPLLCTMKKVRLQVAVVTVFTLLYNLPRWFEYYLVFNETTNQYVGEESSMSKSKVYLYVYQNGFYSLFVFLGPLVVLIVFNVCLLVELWEARKRLRQRQIPIAGEAEETNLTVVMIVIMLMFVVCQTPAFINQLLVHLEEYVCGKPYYYFYHISNILISANSSINFVVYCAFRQKFRDRLRKFCMKNKNAFKQIRTLYYNGKRETVYSNSPATIQHSDDQV